MHPFIKKFIENNIDIIEQSEWEHVFLNWYNDAEEIWPDTELFVGFVESLSDASVEPDMSKRHDVLYDEILFHMEHMKKDKFNDLHHVGRFSLRNRLHSQLGYTDEEVYKIMDEAAKELGLRYTTYYGGGYTW